MADEILKEEAAKEAALKQEALTGNKTRVEGEVTLDEGLLTDEQLAELAQKLEAEKNEKYKEQVEQLKKDVEELKTSETLVNEDNLATLLYTCSKVQLNDPLAKAAELTAFIESLLRPGIYSSTGEAYEQGVPVGTFIIIDDPNTDEREFKVEVVTEPFSIEGDETKEPVEEAKEEEAAKPLSPEA